MHILVSSKCTFIYICRTLSWPAKPIALQYYDTVSPRNIITAVHFCCLLFVFGFECGERRWVCLDWVTCMQCTVHNCNCNVFVLPVNKGRTWNSSVNVYRHNWQWIWQRTKRSKRKYSSTYRILRTSLMDLFLILFPGWKWILYRALDDPAIKGKTMILMYQGMINKRFSKELYELLKKVIAASKS